MMILNVEVRAAGGVLLVGLLQVRHLAAGQVRARLRRRERASIVLVDVRQDGGILLLLLLLLVVVLLREERCCCCVHSDHASRETDRGIARWRCGPKSRVSNLRHDATRRDVLQLL